MRIPAELVPDLLTLTRYAGSNLLLAQAAGGNQSVKDEFSDRLWVKASGVRMDAVTERTGLVELRTSTVRDLVRNGPQTAYSRREMHEWSVRQTLGAALDATVGRPSLESGLHALLGRVVLHLHPVYVNAFTCMKGGYELLAESVQRQFIWIPYATPGQELAVALEKSVRDWPDGTSLCCVLENHGFVSSGNTAQDIIELSDTFTQIGQRVFGALDAGLLRHEPPQANLLQLSDRIRSVLCAHGREVVVKAASFGAFNMFANAEELWLHAGPLVPDDVIFSGLGIRTSPAAETVEFVEDVLPSSLAIAVPGYGTILIAPNQRLMFSMEETLLAHILVRVLIARRGTPNTLAPDEIDYLNNMESEKYRIALTVEGSA